MSQTTDPGGDDLQGPGDVGDDPGSDFERAVAPVRPTADEQETESSGSTGAGGDGDMDVPPTSNDDLTDDTDS
jgi:hypothetical protein